MKKQFWVHLATALLFSAIVLFGLSSCEKNQEGTLLDVAELVEDVEYKIIEENIYTVEEAADLLYGPEGADPDKADLRRRFIENANLPNDDIDQGFAPMYKWYKYYYYTKDQLGYPIMLSAFMSVGLYWFFGEHFTDQDNIYLVCPYTHTKESECATEDKGGWEFTFFLTLDNMFIMPDGQGFGSNAGNVQPYVDHKTQSQQIYDALRAGYNLYMKEGGKMEKGWHLRVVGASQGAGNALAVHKLLDTTFEKHGNVTMLATYLWNFEYSKICCGPYSPEATMQAYHKWGKVTYPCVIPLVIKSMLACNPDLALKYDETEFFSEEWNNNKEDFDRIYRDKTMNTDDLNCYICEKLGIAVEDKKNPPAVPLTKMLSEEMNDADSPIYKDLIECLKKQDLTTGWTPLTPAYVSYSENDEVVPYINSKMLLDFFGRKAVKLPLMFDHVTCCEVFMGSWW